jgi:CRP/FNR family cyclic AMP-dependent transcriptional regulator
MELQWYLNEKDFFSGLGAEKKIFISLAKKREIRKNEFLFTEEETGDSVFYLHSGEVRISSVNAWGKESIVFIRRAGEMFGLAEAIGGAKRACSARAMTACCLYEIKREEFEKLLSQQWVLSRRVMGVLGSRLRYLGEQLENLMSCNVTTRLLKLLFYLSCQKLIDQNGNESVTIPIKLTQEQIAGMIGSCQQTVSEILKQLQEDGLISISRKNREITILKPADLMNSL